MMERRKATFKLYPNVHERETLERWLRLHCELYNAALEERIGAWQKARVSISYYDQQNNLPEIKRERPELVALGSHALQETLRRLDRAFQAFFRRVKAGQAPGFPRFRAAARFSGFTYPDPAGWKLLQKGGRVATLRLGSGADALWLRARGMHRFDQAVANDLTITRSNGEWFASVTFRVAAEDCARPRSDHACRGVDLGIDALATFDDGELVTNPRWIREMLPAIAGIQRARARKRRGSVRYKRLSKQLANVHAAIATQRHNDLHQLTTQWVSQCALLATETLQIKNMSASARGTRAAPGRNVRAKAGLNREILSVSFAKIHQMLEYKAAEAGTRLHLANTRKLKPTQRCSGCGAVARKSLAQRTHRCGCGVVLPRDQNSALVVLQDAVLARDGRGGEMEASVGCALRANKPKSVTRETPTTAPCA